MAYKANIPQPTDKLRDSQNDLLNNFDSMNAAFNFNHITFDLAGQGKHKWVSFPEQVAAPATAAAEMALYTQQSTLSGVSELYVRRESSGTEIEFTSGIQATPGWTRLPSGILIKWGASTANGVTAFSLPDDGGATIPDFVTIYSVQLTVVTAGGTDTDGAVRLVSYAAPTTINLYASPRSTAGTKAVNFEYFVIGV